MCRECDVVLQAQVSQNVLPSPWALVVLERHLSWLQKSILLVGTERLTVSLEVSGEDGKRAFYSESTEFRKRLSVIYNIAQGGERERASEREGE